MSRAAALFHCVILSAAALAQGPPTPLPGLRAAASVTRDRHGVPHVEAANEHDLFFLNGWVDAEDRLFQMDAARRQAAGTLAELLGPAALPSDVELRTIGVRRAAERTLPALSSRARAAFEAYAEGVNAWVASHPLPREYGPLELTRIPAWTALDCATIGKAIVFQLAFALDFDTTTALLSYQAAGPSQGFDGTALYFQDLWSEVPFDPVTTIPPRWGRGSSDDATAAVPGPSGSCLQEEGARLARRCRERLRGIPFLENALDREKRNGSNFWALAGRHTESGLPILANDPHLALAAPPSGIRSISAPARSR